jgi:hypothetical protein
MATGHDKVEGAGLDLKNLVDVHLHQSSSVNQLWTTYVVATFAGGTFAITAGREGGVELLYAGAIGFLAFTIGHTFLVWSGLTRMRLAATDISKLARNGIDSGVVGTLGKPVTRWPSLVCHFIIDFCVLGAFADRISKWTPPG